MLTINMNAKTNPIDIDISMAEPEWKESFLDVDDVVQMAVYHTVRMATLPDILKDRELETSVVLANDDLIQVLNREYRGMDKATNVLSFAQMDSDFPVPEEEAYHIGDIILSYQTIDREAREQGKFFKDHFTHMVVHGTLHLLGYDHQNDDEATHMETLEIRILEKMNIQNPYMEDFSMA